MTMVERVAAVLQQQMSKVSSGTRTYDDIARKVIEAMREPTAAMLVSEPWLDDDGIAWRDMIDRALS